MVDLLDRAQIYMQSERSAVELLDGYARAGSEAGPRPWSWNLGHDRLTLSAPFEGSQHRPMHEQVASTSRLRIETFPPFDDASLWNWADQIQGFLERLCVEPGVRQWILETDEGHPVAYWDEDAAVVNSDVHPMPSSLREPLFYRSMELFERLGFDYALVSMGQWGTPPRR